MATTQTITIDEYTVLKNEQEALRKKMTDAESEFMYQTYAKMLYVLNERYSKATEMVIALERREIRAEGKKKREQLNGATASA